MRDSRLAVARAMYAMRFPAEDTSGLTMQQLRGREGARVRSTYREHAERTGVEWVRRNYDPNDFAAGDDVNQALSAATTCLYGMAHAVIVALGCSPGLGFVHTGHDRSFVYDIADLYKAEVAIPVAFDVAAANVDDIPSVTRRTVREVIRREKLLTRCVQDIKSLLLPDEPDDTEEWDADVVYLWDDAGPAVASGQSFEDPEAEVPW